MAIITFTTRKNGFWKILAGNEKSGWLTASMDEVVSDTGGYQRQ
jgi:hypothetical protein